MNSSNEKDFDDILEDIAKKLHLKADINRLGKVLGCDPAHTCRFCDANEKQGMNYMGTLDMLRAWREGQHPAKERDALRAALLKAGLRRLAINHLGTLAPGEQTAEASSSNGEAAATSSKAGSNKREVTNEQIYLLSRLLPHDKCEKLFEALGFDYNYHQNYLKKHLGDYSAAANELLHAWKTYKGGFEDELDVALLKAELGGLISKYKN